MRFAALTAGSLIILLLFAALHALLMAQRLAPADLLNGAQAEIHASTVRLVAVGLLYIAVVTLGAAFLSHRMMGPLARLEEEIKKITESPDASTELHVRDGDDLEGVVHAINHLIRKKRKNMS